MKPRFLALRHQLAVLQQAALKRPHLSRADRLLWVLLSRVWTGWRRSVQIVQPAPVVRWHRRAFAVRWRWRSRRRRVGRPAVALDVRTLIRHMRSANPLWGAPRIHGELRKLGIEVSQTTVAKYVGRRRTPPSSTWRTFLNTHVAQLASTPRRAISSGIETPFMGQTSVDLALDKDAPESRTTQAREHGAVVECARQSLAHDLQRFIVTMRESRFPFSQA